MPELSLTYLRSSAFHLFGLADECHDEIEQSSTSGSAPAAPTARWTRRSGGCGSATAASTTPKYASASARFTSAPPAASSRRNGQQSARGRLALIVLLDQFSRHIHRGTGAAFAQDPAAQRLATDGIERGLDRDLIPAARSFFYLPLEHAEDIALQRLSVESFRRLCDEVAPAWRKDYESFLDYAQRHHDIIARFGRFPHRNAALGRQSTPEEIEIPEAAGLVVLGTQGRPPLSRPAHDPALVR